MTDMHTPLGRARGRGSALSGTRHFWYQRLTGLANLALVIALGVLLFFLDRGDFEAARRLVAHPASAFVLICALLSVCFHMKLGMQTIIEDYIHHEGLRLFLVIANIFLCIAVALAGLFPVLAIAFGG